MIYDVVIIGAGIVGCACARECALAGMRVAIVERNLPGGGTTGAGMGHVVVMDDSAAQLAMTRYSRELWRELKADLPVEVEYESPGTLWLAADDEELAEVEAKHAKFAEGNISAEIIDGLQLAGLEPNLRPGLAGGLLVPDDGVISPPAAASYFLEQAQRHGARLLCEHAVIGAGQGRVRLAGGSELECKSIVMACGTDVSLLPWLPLQKRKGHLVLTEAHPGFLHHQLVELGYLKSAHKTMIDSVAFNVQPRSGGHLLIGSSRQYRDEDPASEEGVLRSMLDRAYSYMPGLAQLTTARRWTGFRAATQDKLPLIGPAMEEDPTLLLAMGFEGLGITSAPGAARLLLDHLLGRESEICPAPYLPSRIAGQALTEIHAGDGTSG